MERVDDELHIDYDSIEAPQFVDFHALSMINDDEEDPALKFFEVKEYVDDKKEDFDMQVVDERRSSDEIDKDQEQDAVIPLAGDDEGKDAIADAEDHQIEMGGGDAEQVENLPMAVAADPDPIPDDDQSPENVHQISALANALENLVIDGNDSDPVPPPHAPIAEEVENIENVDPVPVPAADELVPVVVASPEPQEQDQPPLVAVEQALNEVEVEHPLPRAAPAPRVAHPAAINSEIPRKLISTATGVTVPKPFHFHSARHRPADHPAPADKKDIGPGFRARPAPLKVLHGGPTGLKDKPEVRATVAVAPHFASDDRIRSRRMRASQAPTATAGVVKENLDPKSGDAGSHRSTFRSVPSTPVRGANSTGRGRSPSPALIRHADKPATVMKPFSFEEREKERKRLREEKLRQQEREKEEAPRHIFHANPLPSFKPHLPPKNPIPVTNPAPFQLKVDERGSKHQEIFRKKLEDEERLRKEQATFHANPPVVIFKQPFEPEPSDKLPTEPLDIQLNSDRRAQERDFFESQLREKELFEQEQREQDEANRLLMEQKQAQELRKQLVHKAQPIKGTRAFEVKQSSKPLTHPMSPAFAPLPSQRRNLHQIHNNVQPPQ